VNKLITQKPLGGRYDYAAIPNNLNFVSMAWAVALGALAGITAVAFVCMSKLMKIIVHKCRLNQYPLLLSIIGGSLIGVFGMLFPQSLFWAENEMPWALSYSNYLQSGNATAAKLPYAIYPGPIAFHSPLLPWELGVSGLIKLVTICITVSSGWPGGIIYPLFMAGAMLGASWYDIVIIFLLALSLLLITKLK